MTNAKNNPNHTPTITSLEQKISTLQAIIPQTKQIKSDLTAAKKTLKNLYATAKNAALTYEKENHDHILFVQSTKNITNFFITLHFSIATV